jgi:hypothetical protein
MGGGASSVFCGPPEARKVEPGFVPLFNGTDLTGWREVQGKPGSFRVESGVLVGRRDRQAATAYWLSSNRQYGDFELRLEYLLRPGGNSGVFIRVPGYSGRTSREGMEIQLLDDGSGSGKPHAGSTGSIYQVVAPETFAAKPAGQWNDLEIYCLGERIRVTLNGKKLVDAKMSEHQAIKNRPRHGYIGLSAHTDEVRFRNIRIRELNPAERHASKHNRE